MKIPEWTECEAAFAETGTLNPLQLFILVNEPSGPKEKMFRKQLAEMIEFVCKDKSWEHRVS